MESVTRPNQMFIFRLDCMMESRTHIAHQNESLWRSPTAITPPAEKGWTRTTERLSVSQLQRTFPLSRYRPFHATLICDHQKERSEKFCTKKLLGREVPTAFRPAQQLSVSDDCNGLWRYSEQSIASDRVHKVMRGELGGKKNLPDTISILQNNE